MHKLIELQGVGPKYAEMLKRVGIESQEDLLRVCSGRGGVLE
ncbi:hypothetical protein PGH44_12415 [Legionella pneumophila]|nr:hypothetical protein PGH44_12415 [Legionella pneumophila]